MTIAQNYWYLFGGGEGFPAAAIAYQDRVEADGGTVQSLGCVPSEVWDWVAPTYNAEVTAYIARLATEGFDIPSGENLSLLDTFVSTLKGLGAWDIADYIGIGAQNSGSINATRVNLKSPLDSLGSINNAVAFTNKIGTTGNQVDAYIGTGYNPATYGGNWTLNDAGVIVQMQSAGASPNALIGGDLLGTTIRRRNFTLQRLNAGTNFLNSSFDFTETSGVKAMYRTSSTDVRLYNGKVGSSRVQNSDTVRDMEMQIHKDFVTYGDHTIGMVIFGGSFESVHDAVVDAINAYINGVGVL